MANRKILVDPSRWVVDSDHKMGIRYRIVTNDLNVRSAFSPMYKVQLPPINEIFSDIDYAVVAESVDDNTVIRVDWSTTPSYDNIVYYIFLQKPGESGFTFLKSTQTTSFAYVLPTNVPGNYNIAVTIPTTTNTALTNARLFVATAVI